MGLRSRQEGTRFVVIETRVARHVTPTLTSPPRGSIKSGRAPGLVGKTPTSNALVIANVGVAEAFLWNVPEDLEAGEPVGGYVGLGE